MKKNFSMTNLNLRKTAKAALNCHLGFSPKENDIVLLESGINKQHFHLTFAISGHEYINTGFIKEYCLDGYTEIRKFDGVDCEILPLNNLTLTIRNNLNGENISIAYR